MNLSLSREKDVDEVNLNKVLLTSHLDDISWLRQLYEKISELQSQISAHPWYCPWTGIIAKIKIQSAEIAECIRADGQS